MTTSMDFLLIAGGTLGSGLIIVAYFLNQVGRLTAADIRYPVINLIGAVLILLSLIAEWNLPTLVIEGFWVAISLYGIWSYLARRRSA
jgi:hypothetical protein